jgi:hypothetical protein
VLGIAVVLALVFLLQNDWFEQVNSDIDSLRSLPELRERLEESRLCAQALDEQVELAQWRVATKERLIENLIARRCTLGEVTNRFLELDRSLPPAIEHVRRRYPGASDAHKMALNILMYSSSRVKGSLLTRSTVMARLTREYLELSRKPLLGANSGA